MGEERVYCTHERMKEVRRRESVWTDLILFG